MNAFWLSGGSQEHVGWAISGDDGGSCVRVRQGLVYE